MDRVESVLGAKGMRVAARLHGMGDVQRYNNRMAAVEYAIEHDDGQSMRALDKADVILLAPSRCGKTPTTMYLALQHGIFVANYPLVEEDFETSDLPRPVREPPGPLLRPDHVAQPAQPGPQRAAPQLPLRLDGAVQLRAAAGRVDVPQPPHPDDQLLGQVRRGDVHRHPADPRRQTRPRPPISPPLTPPRSLNHVRQRLVVLRDRPDRPGAGRRQELLPRGDGGNLASAGVRVPDGFATTANAYRRFIGETGLAEKISAQLADLDTDDVRRLAEVGKSIRQAVVAQPFPADLEADIRAAYDAAGRARTTSCRSPSAPRPRPRTCRTPRSPASRRPSSTSAASTPS